jgi:MFS family permease
MSRVDALWQPYVLYGGVAALGMSTAFVPCNATVVRWFVRRRGLAVGLATAGGSLGTFVLPPVAHWLVSGLGWRGAYLAFGVAVFVVLNAVALLMRRDPNPRPHPDGAAWTVAEAEVAGWPVRVAIGPAPSGCSSIFTPPALVPSSTVPLARDLGVTLRAPLRSARWHRRGGGRVAMVVSDRIGRRPRAAIGLALQVASFGTRPRHGLSAPTQPR